MKKFKNRTREANLSMLLKILLTIVFFSGASEGVLSQITQIPVTYAGRNSDNLITISKNSSYVIKIEVSRETLVNISIFDESDKLVDILLYEYIKAGKMEYDLAKLVPIGNFKCKIMIGEDTEVLRLIVI